MEMTACPICGKVHVVSKDPLCKACRGLTEIVYEKARNYLRDNPKLELNASGLAEAIDEDMRIVQLLMLEGRFTGNPDDEHMLESEDEKKRKQLLAELQKNLSMPSEERQKIVTYGTERHGRSTPEPDSSKGSK